MRWLLLGSLLVLGLALPALAAPRGTTVILLTYQGVSLRQLVAWNLPAWQQLLARSSIGVMNNKSAEAQTFENVAVTLGAGTRAWGNRVDQKTAAESPLAHAGYNADEVLPDGLAAGEFFMRDSGLRVPSCAVVQTAIHPLQALNRIIYYPIYPGMLGEQLQRHGVTVAVYGNADQGTNHIRNAVTIAMNRDGWVAHGDVGHGTLTPDAGRPFGVRTNYDAILGHIAALAGERRFIVVDAGDGARVEAARAWMTPARYAVDKRVAFDDCCRFVLRLSNALSRTTARYQVCLAMTAPAARDKLRNDLLMPVLYTGSGIPSGLLTSATTRRDGVLINIDIPVTVLADFGITPDRSMLGLPITAQAYPRALPYLQQANEQMVATYSARAPLMRGYIIVLLFCLVVSVPSVLMSRRVATGGWTLVRPAVWQTVFIALMLVPLALLLAPALHLYATLPTAAWMTIFPLLAAVVVRACCKDLRIVLAVTGLATATAIAGDLLAGAPLMKHSVLGYDAIAGVRFYGLGNEYLGVLLGASLLGLSALADYCAPARRRIVLPVILYALLIIVVIGHPAFGSKFGGMLPAVVAFTFALVRAQRVEDRRKLLMGLAVGAVILLAGFIGVNLLRSHQEQTHIGRAFSDALYGGPWVLVQIALRKWAMDLRLLAYSFWAWTLGACLCVSAIIYYRPIGFVRATLRDHPIMNAGLQAILLGSLIGLVCNDSGVVMAATSILYLGLPLLLMVMERVTAKGTA